MLPFLKNKKRDAGISMTYRKRDEEPNERQQDEVHPAVMAAAEDIMRAISQNDVKHLALAIQSAFQILDSMPHEEGEHTNDDEMSDDEE